MTWQKKRKWIIQVAACVQTRNKHLSSKHSEKSFSCFYLCCFDGVMNQLWNRSASWREADESVSRGLLSLFHCVLGTGLRGRPTAVNAQMLLQVMFVFEGFSTLGAFELAVSSSFVQQLRLWREKQEVEMCWRPSGSRRAEREADYELTGEFNSSL